MRFLVLLLLTGVSCVKAPADVKPIEGWSTQEGWTGSCFYPKNYDELGPGDRLLARQVTLTEMMSQWGGERADGLSLDADVVMRVETVLLGQPNHIEQVSRDNLQHCIAAVSGSGTGAWRQWYSGLAKSLTVGQCLTAPLNHTQYNYLDISGSWQNAAGVCENDRVRILGTGSDYYRITEDGPWINVEGDLSMPALSAEYPCNVEGCFVGQLILRYTDYDGVTAVVPVGTRRFWTAPGHGQIEVMINDTTFYDNTYKEEGGVIHHTNIEYSDAD